MSVHTSTLNNLFVEKATLGNIKKLGDVSAIFIADRLYYLEKGKAMPKVTCDFGLFADLLTWSFSIERDGEEKRTATFELSTQQLMSSDMPVTYWIERGVREALGLNEATSDAHKTPVIES